MSTAKVEFTIVTGLSGAGKTQAMKALEDLDYFCIDNLPPLLLPKLIEMHAAASEEERQFAIAMDVRGKEHFSDLFQALEWLDNSGFQYNILFLDCADSVMIRRFSETRRRHPLANQGSLYDIIALERKLLADIKERADFILDTSTLRPSELKERLHGLLSGEAVDKFLSIEIMSFGFKYGVPNDADIIFDVRFLPNPHYIPKLKPFTGKDKVVSDYVLKWPQTNDFINKFYSLLASLIPAYSKEGKARLTVGIGCTGGKHRSVAISIELGNRLNNDGFSCQVRHREQ